MSVFVVGFFIKGEEVCLQQIPAVHTVTETIIKVKQVADSISNVEG